ncbi:hypothetical protein PR048_012050 [Dryococelus australis]|uniref:Uncharacterized protein n=1 Tax=Dryococelus australis TaxID=614101 RepID=A0ABQ9HNC2_9NEOP|nr:hypothetical protein PR048_012050 [Dryococelus australis]
MLLKFLTPFKISDKYRTDYGKVLEAFEAYCKPRKNVPYERDCIFMGVRDTALQQEMLRINHLTLEKVCELGKLAESSTQQLQCLQGEREMKGLMIQPC